MSNPESPYRTKSRGDGCASAVEYGVAARTLVETAIDEMAAVAARCASIRTAVFGNRWAMQMRSWNGRVRGKLVLDVRSDK
jgi:hypothetical protein